MTKPQGQAPDRGVAEGGTEGARDGAAPRRRATLRRRFARVLLLVLLALGLGGGLGVVRFLERGDPLIAPAWLGARIEARIEAQSPGLDIAFSELSLVFEDGWRPRVRMRDLRLVLPETGTRLLLNEITARLARAPLLRGQLQPREITVLGAQLRLRRRADGSFDIVSQQPRAGGRDMAEAMDELKAALDTPQLAALDRIEGLGLTLVYEDLRADRRWSLDGGRLVLDRDGDALVIRGDFSVLGGRSYATLIESSYTTRIDRRGGDLQLNVQDMPAEDLATQSPALAWLGVLRAPLTGALRVALEEGGVLGPLHATLQIGQGALRPSDGTRPIPFRAARSYFSYDPASRMLRFDEFSVESRWVSFLSDGAFRIGTGPGGGVEMTGQLSASEIVANPAELFAAPVRLDRADAELRMRFDPFEVTLGELRIAEGGHALTLDGWMRAGAQGWGLGIEGALSDPVEGGPALSPDDVLAYWPPGVAMKSRRWVSRNLLEGGVSKLQFGLRAADGERPEVQAGFDFDGVTLAFLKTMPPIEGLNGHGSLDGRRFVVQAQAGRVVVPGGGALDVAGSSFVVPDVKVKPADGVLDLDVAGVLGDVLALLDREPFRFLSRAGRGPDLATGQAQLAARIGFPLMKDPPRALIRAEYAARVTDVDSDTVLPGRRLSAPALRVRGDGDGIRVAGTGQVDGVAFDGSWQMAFGPDAAPSRVEARLTLDPAAAGRLGLGLPPGTLRGAGPVALSLDLPREGNARFRVDSDLAGIGLSIPALGWGLGTGARGRLSAEGEIGDGIRVERFDLDAPGLVAGGSLSTVDGGGLAALSLSRLGVGNWLDVSARYVPGGTPAAEITGGWLDLGRAPDAVKAGGAGAGGQGTRGGGPGPVEVALDRLRLSDDLALTGFRGTFAGGGAGRFGGRVNGGAPVSGRMTPGAIEVSAEDAAAVLASAGFLRDGSGGAMRLMLRPLRGGAGYDGHLEIDDLRIRQAPAIAEILNALSIVGLLEQLGGSGILFSDVEADFRLAGDSLVVTRASAVGASMGISLDGRYDMAADGLDMQGVFSPLYLLNGIGSLLTRRGEGLIGFNFRLQGPAADPRVRVNPLSVLTPGMFREIFRRPAPELAPEPAQ